MHFYFVNMHGGSEGEEIRHLWSHIVKTHFIFLLQPGTELQEILEEKTFSEPRLIIFTNEQDAAQGFIVAEKQVLFEVEGFTVVEGLISLIASYYVFYVSYPKSSPVTGVLLFVQEVLLGQPDVC